jgi:hypothetical protein
VLVVAGVGIGFYLLGRSTVTPAPTASPTAPSTPPATTGATLTPTYSPTDQNGSPEPGLPRGEVIAGQGGTKSGPAGLPLGYTHDQTGAVSTATNYLMWMNSIKIGDKNIADEMAAASAADEKTRDTMIDSFDALRSGLEGIEDEQMEPARGAYALAEFSSTQATVYIWSPLVITDTSGSKSSLWSINSVRLAWSGDWKLSGGLVDRVGRAAVDPSDVAGNPSSEEKHSILSRTPADPGEITDTADQSWFEYGNAPR